jgi:hypothetical protein
MDRDKSRRTVVDFSQLARDLDSREPIDFAQPHHRKPELPGYVSHADGVGEIAALTAAAVVQQFEITAQSLIAMGEQQKLVVKRCEEVIARANASNEKIMALAEEARAEGKANFEEIEKYALLLDDVNKTCGELRQKIVGEVSAVLA